MPVSESKDGGDSAEQIVARSRPGSGVKAPALS